MSEPSDDECDSVEEIITVRPLPVPRLKQVQEHQKLQKTWTNVQVYDNGRGSDGTKDSQREADTSGFPPIIPLNVGGHIYMTRLSTLLKYSDSMLAAMFSGRHHIDKDEDGNYFLDSNGAIFGQILEFLRYGSLVPEKDTAYLVYRDANYYGLHELVDRLALRPEIASITVKEAQKAQFPNYAEVKESVIHTAIANASVSRVGEVNVYAFRKEFVAKAHNFNMKHNCITDMAHVVVGPWDSNADEETFIRCLENDLLEDGYNLKPHESKRKCRYYNGQTCQKFIFRISISFD